MVKKKKDKPEDATPAEDAYVDEPEVASDPEPEYTPDATAEYTPPKADAVSTPTGTDIAKAVMDMSIGCTAGDYKACAAALKAAQGEFAQMWHKEYS